MTKALTRTLKLLELNRIDRDIYTWNGKSVGFQRIFGGQIMAQCLVAAYQTVEKKRTAHSFHSYFLRPGDFNQNIIFDVDRIRDGGSFSTRRVVAIQNGEPIFNTSISFQIREKGLSHQIDMPDILPPEKCVSDLEIRKQLANKVPKKMREMFTRERPIELRSLPGEGMFQSASKRPPYKYMWMRAVSKLPNDINLHQAILAYASDMGLLSTSLNPHKLNFASGNFQSASLDHGMWFHRPFRADEWMLYSTDSPSASNARGFNRGSIYTRKGILIASAVQEGLMRVVKG